MAVISVMRSLWRGSRCMASDAVLTPMTAASMPLGLKVYGIGSASMINSRLREKAFGGDS